MARSVFHILLFVQLVLSVQLVCHDGSVATCSDGNIPTIIDDPPSSNPPSNPPCPKPCNVFKNACDRTTAPSCIYPNPKVRNPRAACACRPGYKASNAADGDTQKHWRLPIIGQEHRVWVAEGVKCDKLCGGYGAQSCMEVTVLGANCVGDGPNAGAGASVGASAGADASQAHFTAGGKPNITISKSHGLNISSTSATKLQETSIPQNETPEGGDSSSTEENQQSETSSLDEISTETPSTETPSTETPSTDTPSTTNVSETSSDTTSTPSMDSVTPDSATTPG